MQMGFITKGDFEAALPVASTKNSDIFDRLYPYIETATTEVLDDVLGEAGRRILGDGQYERMTILTKNEVCYHAFLANFRSLDIVLTATGFGVVSTQDTAPASKMRTDALKSQLDIQAKRNFSSLLSELFRVEGWGQQSVRYRLVQTLFWHFDFLEKYAGKESPTVNDWRQAQPYILEADGLVRRHIGNGIADKLMDRLTSGNLTEKDVKVVTIIQQLIGLHIAGNKSGEKIYLHRLLNTLEADLDYYTEYRDSEAYKYNHFKGYENTKDSGMFIFQG